MNGNKSRVHVEPTGNAFSDYVRSRGNAADGGQSGAMLRQLAEAFAQQMTGGGAATSEARYAGRDDTESRWPVERGDFQKDYVLRPGDHETFPTWSFWGTTTIRVDNTGPVPSSLVLQAASGAPEIHYFNPGEGKTIKRQYAAFPVHVMNSSEAPESQLTVRVW